MIKPRFFVIVAAGILLVIAMLTLPFQVGSARGSWLEQTWPSRTPTPVGGPNPTSTTAAPPTDDNPGGNPTPNNTPNPGPGDTPAPGDTAVPTTAATVVLATPPGGYLATAQPCGVPPTIQALGLVNIRSGPGLDYDAIDNLVYLETRPIVGRAQNATWWLIQLPNNITGWVANQAVAVQGYTGSVPIVVPPLLNGASPTPGALWQPTPNPVCTPQPTPTATNTPVVEEAGATTQSVSSTNPTAVLPSPTATMTPEPAPTEAPATAAPSNTAVPAAPTTNTGSPITDSEQGGQESEDPPSASSWILFVGVGLVAIAGATFVLRQRG